MSNSVVKEKAKQQKMERLAKKSRNKKILTIGILILAVLAVIGIFQYINNNKAEGEGETYSLGGQKIQLFADNTFTASLAHGVKKSGTYIKTQDNDTESVIFFENDNTATGRIINGSLHLPGEWDDDHNHGNVFKRQ